MSNKRNDLEAAEVLEAYQEFYKQNSVEPSLRTLALCLKLKSSDAPLVRRRLNELVETGYLRKKQISKHYGHRYVPAK